MHSFSDLPELTRAKLTLGIAHFNAGAWWEAHEAWEEAWQEEDGLTRLFLQALIQLAAAYHKGLRMGNPRGMASLFARSMEKFGEVARSVGLEGAYGGVSLDPIRHAAEQGRILALAWQSGQLKAFDLAAVIAIPLPK